LASCADLDELFAHHHLLDPEALERLLRRRPKLPRLVCTDGVNSMTGNPSQVTAFAALARDHDALLHLDGELLAALDRLVDVVPLRAA
jgi:7-keto-8-aminopelargonate synthetase-like enzyme